MNRTAIEWTNYTWNPVTGCKHGCPYCYGQKIARRFPANFPNGFKPTFHDDRLLEPGTVKNPSKIFTVSMGDLFGEWVPKDWIEAVFESISFYDEHTFQILTKNPKKIVPSLYQKTAGSYFSYFAGGDFLRNAWLGTSVEYPEFIFRINDLRELKKQAPWTLFVSFEPLLEAMPEDLDLSGIDWVIIGAQTNPRKNPNPEWVQNIIDRAKDYGCKVFLKNTIQEWWPETFREFPEVKSLE